MAAKISMGDRTWEVEYMNIDDPPRIVDELERSIAEGKLEGYKQFQGS